MRALAVISVVFLLGVAIGANAVEQTPGTKKPATRDYKNRPDPCELKSQKKSSAGKAAVPAAKPANPQKR